MKKILSINAIIIIMISVFLVGYTGSLQVPVYADSNTDQWLNVTTNEQLVEAFKYYCKSRDLTIEGSVADAVTTFTTKTFNGLCNTLGIDVTALQAQLKYQTDGNLGNRFLFTSLGIDAYNRIFAQFLQDNNITVGDTVNDKSLFNGKYYNGYFLYLFSSYNSISQVGLPITNGKTLYDTGNGSLTILGKTISYTRTDANYENSYFKSNTYGQFGGYLSYIVSTQKAPLNRVYNSDIGVGQNTNNNNLYVVLYTVFKDTSNATRKEITQVQNISNNVSTQNVNIYITTNNNVINNNVYEGDTIINNNGTTEEEDDDDPIYDPYPDGGGTITPPYNSGGDGTDGTINFPDLDFNLPEINWSLGDLSQKFPFSIPFDMIAFLTLLNGEPQAPHITGSIPLTSHYTWELDLDFSQFDTFAGIMRGLEFVGFMFFLISATINIVRG